MFGWKRYSVKTKVAAEDWLKQFGISLQSLSETQQEEVLRYAKKRRVIKWYWISGVTCLFYFGGGIYGYFVSSELYQFHLEYIADMGKSGIDPEMLGIVKFNLYSIISFPLVCFGMGLFIIVSVFSNLYNTFRNEKTLKAFMNEK